jgi:murein endopeptidase
MKVSILVLALLICADSLAVQGFTKVVHLVREQAGEPYTICTYSDGTVIQIDAFKPCPQFRLTN